MPMIWRKYRSYLQMVCDKSDLLTNSIPRLLSTGAIKPVVDSVYEMDDVLQAYDKIMTSRAKGKIIVKVDPSIDWGEGGGWGTYQISVSEIVGDWPWRGNDSAKGWRLERGLSFQGNWSCKFGDDLVYIFARRLLYDNTVILPDANLNKYHACLYNRRFYAFRPTSSGDLHHDSVVKPPTKGIYKSCCAMRKLLLWIGEVHSEWWSSQDSKGWRGYRVL